MQGKSFIKSAFLWALFICISIGCSDDDRVRIEESSDPPFFVTIFIPSHQSVFTEGYPKKITGRAGIGDKDLPDSLLVWESSLDGVIGTGSLISTDVLSIGEHVITLKAFEGYGNSVSQSITVEKVKRPQILVSEVTSSKTRKDSLRAASFFSVDYANGTITDRRTGLVWQRSITSELLDWNEADTYCSNLNFAEHGDWRVPEIYEYESLITQRRPTIKKVFKNYSVRQWTKTNHPMLFNTAMTVQFEYFVKHQGFIPQSGSARKSAIHYVRCVR